MSCEAVQHVEDNLSAVMHGIGDLRLEQKPFPSKPGNNEVLVAINSVGICGSDVHTLYHGRLGPSIPTKPMVLGHESSGIIVKIGKGVNNLKPGDRIALELGVLCRVCDYCKNGRYNLCPDSKFGSISPTDGTMTRYFLMPADFCYKLPDHISYEEGALVEPLSVAVYACKRGKLAVGENVLILGAGPIGLITLITAKAMGARSVCITDVNSQRLNLAKEIGADHTILINNKINEKNYVEQIEKVSGDRPVLTFDCCGVENTIRLGILATKTGGRLVLVGLGSDEVKIPLIDACIREVDIIGVFRYANCYPLALSLLSTGKVNVKPLITHMFKLENAKEAFEVSKTGRDNAIKVIIKCAKD